MEYADTRSRYDAALEELLLAVEKFDGLFPPRNTALHLRNPALSHRSLRESRDHLAGAIALFSEATRQLAAAALDNCPDMLPGIGPQHSLPVDSLNQTA